MPIFTYKARPPQRPQGQGIFSYGSANVRPRENIFPQAAPEPAYPQGRIPSRSSRMQIAVMALYPFSNSGIAGDFVPYWHELSPMFQPHNSGQKRLTGRSGINSERTNIRKPAAIAYGSLFELEKGY